MVSDLKLARELLKIGLAAQMGGNSKEETKMKKTLVAIIAILVLSLCSFAGDNDNCAIKEHGTMKTGVEPGCWMFVTDAGKSYQPVSGPESMYREGLTGTLWANPTNQTYSFCQNGPIVRAHKFEADQAVTVVGIVSYQNGTWTLTTGSKVYQPFSVQESFYKEGSRVRVKGVVRQDIPASISGGEVIEVLESDFIGAGTENDNERDLAAICQASYSRCLVFCGENLCYVSCETIYDSCMASH